MHKASCLVSRAAQFRFTRDPDKFYTIKIPKMTKHKLFPLFGFVAGIIFTMLIFLSYTSKKSLTSFFELPQQIKSVNLNKPFDFAGEPMPVNEDTRERLEREYSVKTYCQYSKLLNLK